MPEALQGRKNHGMSAFLTPSDGPDDAPTPIQFGAGGKRRKREPGGRRHQRTVRFTDAELAVLQHGAQRSGVDIATFIATAALEAAARPAHTGDTNGADQGNCDRQPPPSPAEATTQDPAEPSTRPNDTASTTNTGAQLTHPEHTEPPETTTSPPRRQPHRKPRRRRKHR